MSDTIKIHFGGMYEGQISFTQLSREYSEILRVLESDIGRTLNSWDGDAKAAYVQAQAEWHKAGDRLAAAARTLGQTIGDSSEGYYRIENINFAIWV